MTPEEGPRSPFEEILNSRGKVRLLTILSRHKALHLSRLARETGLSSEYTTKHLEELVRAGVVREKRFGRLRMFSLNRESEIARRIAALLSTEPD